MPVTVQAHTKSVRVALEVRATDVGQVFTRAQHELGHPLLRHRPADGCEYGLHRRHPVAKATGFPMFHPSPNLDYDSAAAVVCLLRSLRGNARNDRPRGALVRQFSTSMHNLHDRQSTACRVRGLIVGNVF